MDRQDEDLSAMAGLVTAVLLGLARGGDGVKTAILPWANPDHS